MAVNDPIGETPVPDAPAADSWLSKQTPEVQEHVKSLRAENAKHRVKVRDTEAKLAKLGDADKQIIDLQRTNALLKHGAADPEITEFLLRKAGQWDDLDPSSEDFAETLKNRVDDIVRDRPALRGQRNVPARSTTGGPTGGPGGPPSNQVTRSQLADMRPEQIEEALKRGDLNQILGRR